MSRMLGDAFFVVRWEPGTATLRADLQAKFKAATAGISPKVVVGADVKGAQAQIAGLAARMATLNKTLAQLRVGADTKAAEAAIAKLQAQLAALTKQVSSITVKADTSKLDAAIAKELASLAKLRQQMSSLQVDANTAKAAAKVAGLQKQVSDLYGKLDKLTADVDIDAAITKIYALEAEIRVLQSTALKTKLGADATALQAAIAASVAKILAMKRQAADIRIGANIDTAALAAKEAQLLGLEAATEKLAAAADGAGRSWGNATRIIGGGGGIWAATIGGVSLLHIAIDLLIEGLIVVGTSLAALAVGAATTYKAFDQLGVYVGSSLKAMTALGVDAGPLAGKLDAVQKAMAPQVIEAFGGALAIVNGQAGLINKYAPVVVGLFSTWIAKIDLWAAGQRNMGGIIQTGISYLTQLGHILGTLGQAFTNLLTKDPGIARFLLDLVQAAASVINAFSKLPAPIVEATLALHGLYLWSKILIIAPLLSFASALGILSDAQVATAKSALTLRGALAFFATNPWGWAILGAAAIAGLAYEMTQASSSAKNFIAGLDQGLSQANASTAITQISLDVGALRSQIAQVPAENGKLIGSLIDAASASKNFFGQALHDAPLSNQQFINIAKSVTNAVKAFFGWSQIGPQIRQNNNSVAAFTGEIVKLTNEQGNLFHVTGDLIRGQGKLGIGAVTVSQAFALMNMAGVHAGDSFDVMEQKVRNLIGGYTAMSISSGILQNSVNAMTFATLQQDSKVGELNSAWDTFFKTVTGGESGFLSFAQQVSGLYQSLGQVTDTVRLSSGRVTISLGTVGRSAGTTKASITGLNDASIQARETFLRTADAANSQLDSLTLLASAAGLGSKGTGMLTQATKDMLASMLPAAKGSQVMTDVLYALAQRGGYTGANSFRELVKWVGNTKDPMSSLDKIVTTLTTDAANLTTDVKNLSIALGQTLNQAMAQAIFQATGGQKVYDDFANAIIHTGLESKTTRDAALKLAGSLYALTGNTSDAKTEFEAFAQKGLGLTKAQADTLWQQTLPALQKSIDSLHGTTIDIKMLGDGTYSINGQVAPTPSGGVPFSTAVTKAQGGFISGGMPGKDSVLAALMPGEVVVPTKMVQAGAVDHLRGKLPGFGGGGAVPGFAGGGTVTGTLSGNVNVLDSFTAQMGAAFQDTMTTAMVTAMRAAIQSAASAAQRAFAATGPVPAGASASGVTALRAAGARYGWGSGAEWNALNYVEMREAGYSLTATNPTSGAYGMAQFIGGPSEYYQYGGNPNTYWGQAVAMTNYIRQRYADAIAAAGHEAAFSWYHGGGLVGLAGLAGGGRIGGSGHGTAIKPRSNTLPVTIPNLPSYFKSTAALRSSLASAEKSERAAYFGLEHSFGIGFGKAKKGSWLDRNRRRLGDELHTLAARQQSELNAYNALAGKGLTSRGLARLASAARAETRTAQDQLFSAPALKPNWAGGHPLWDKSLRIALAQLISIAMAGTGTGLASGPGGLPVLPPVAHIYGGDVVTGIIGRALAEAVNPFGAARGGLVMDRGGWLRPGPNLAWNLTGRPEHLAPDHGGDLHFHFHNHGVIGSQQELDTWLNTSIRRNVKTRGGGSVQRAYGWH